MITLSTPTLLIDNKSALVLAENGGSWRTRYFATRAARISEECEAGRLELRFCPTKAMLADSFTKLVPADTLTLLKTALWGELPEIPAKDQSIKPSDATWWASMVLSKTCAGHQPAITAGSTMTPPRGNKRPREGECDTGQKDKRWRRGHPRRRMTGNQRDKHKELQGEQGWGPGLNGLD